ncbi:DUF2304 domain-containing protein [Homoserinimonas sp. OAct 916]|uniref:DUF2304 domain-containing protein n=1 Tax=Homoserinimonas sp. OAct 916 TaxID=2211450 RepID=UPI000DBE30A2|nr:DUF2304 domain-containing protein [Homoserinimonas sp. OAct 916]
MLIVFQLLAVLAIAVAAFFMLRGGGARHQAIRRILMMVFIIAAASSVFLPQIWTKLANLFGVARGADLLLYFLVLTFLGFVATSYRRFRALEGQVTELARRIAIDRAGGPTDVPSGGSPARPTPPIRPGDPPADPPEGPPVEK